MYKICKTDQSAKRQREIENALLELMLHRRYEDITVSDLCQRIGLPRKSFYRYFSGKDGALFALIDHVLMDYMAYEAAAGLDERDPLQYMCGLCRYWMGCKALLDALEKSDISGILIQRAILRAADLDSYPHFLQTAQKQLQEYGSMFATCGIVTMMVQWHRDGYAQSLEQMAQLMVRLLSQPLFRMGNQI
jgi:AcrR family transcriptional regulator